jgi:hypothetical protein
VGLISGLGTTTRNTPNQFIPVGQSFFVNGKPLLPLQLNIRTVKEGLLKKESSSNLMFKVKPTKINIGIITKVIK